MSNIERSIQNRFHEIENVDNRGTVHSIDLSAFAFLLLIGADEAAVHNFLRAC